MMFITNNDETWAYELDMQQPQQWKELKPKNERRHATDGQN